MYGIIATLIVIKLLEHNHWTDRKKRATIIIYTDNMETVKRSMELPNVVNITDTLIPEFDLWKLLWDIKSTIKQKVIIQWVKGHQDEDKNGNKIHGPFQRDTQLNIDMDVKAKQGVTLHMGKLIERPVYNQTKLALYTEEGELINDLYTHLQKKENGKHLEIYIKKKFQWTDEHIQTIHWDALEKALKTTTAFQRSKIAQIIFNWQNVGTQKKSFDDSDNACPTSCGEVETQLHYLKCKNPIMIQHRQAECKNS